MNVLPHKVETITPRIALALSGGGFRASIFHLGVLRRLAELGWLQRVDVLSTVSGGSIIGAFAVMRWHQWIQAGADGAAFEQIIAQPFLRQVQQRNFLLEWLSRSPLWPLRKAVNRLFTRTQAAVELLDQWFFQGLTCDQLPERPLLVLNATSLHSIRSWRFTKGGLGDSRIGYSHWNGQPLPLALAVCASASFPPVFPPLRVRRGDYSFSGPSYGETPLPDFDFIPLTDGGVYDNSGMEALFKPTLLPAGKLLEKPEFLLVSDGGAPPRYDFRSSGLPAMTEGLLLYRADQIAREQVTAVRTRWLMEQITTGKRQGLLVSLRSALDRIGSPKSTEYCEFVSNAQQIPASLLPRIRSIRTSLDRFTTTECTALMYHAYLMADCFLWCYRDNMSEDYRVPSNPAPTWRIELSSEMAAQWDDELSNSGRVFRLR
jgi:NTE family protein